MSTTSTTGVLDRLLDPVAEFLTPAVARRLLELRADPKTEAHVRELAEKANEGQLSPEEFAEYEDYVEAIDVIAILQAKARV